MVGYDPGGDTAVRIHVHTPAIKVNSGCKGMARVRGR